ncbi:GNAT family N-acetyltransferase [Streptomyces sp. Ac-502]|uniref:GNAT family N-acetyltransferase n=1 Tax=Streptomyces sp. Ac-502 TaxID=3342801 RepID=UPI003862C7CC
MTRAPVIRHAVRTDLADVVALAAEHAAYERSVPPAADLEERLADALFGPRPQWLRCLVAELSGGELAGYATCSTAFDTWQGREYLSLDCLYLCAEHRGLGLGALLVEAVIGEGKALGVAEMQWNTPDWNAGAIRFYDRFGATRKDKKRFTLALETGGRS